LQEEEVLALQVLALVEELELEVVAQAQQEGQVQGELQERD
jgi:hypothetical protein